MKNSLIRALRWSEKYTKTDMVYLFKNSFWVLLGQVATSMSAFVVMVVVANLVSKEVFGEYRFIISIISILMVFTLPGLDTALVQSTARGYEGQLDLAVKTKMRWGIIASVIAGVISTYYFINDNSSLGLSFAVVAALMPLYGAYFTYFFFLQGKQKFAEASATQAVSRILFLIIMITTAYILPTSTALVAAFLVATIAGQNLGSWWTRRKYPQEQNIDLRLIPYGKSLSLLSAIGIIATNIDKVMTWFLLGAASTAVYAIATLLPLESIRVGRMVSQVLLPKFSKNNSSITFKQFLYKSSWMYIPLTIIFVTYAILAHHLFSWFFPQYMEAVHYSIVGMLILFSNPAYIVRVLFTSSKYEYGLRYTFTVIPIIKALILIVGMYLFGLWGAIGAFVVGGFVELFVHLYLLKGFLK